MRLQLTIQRHALPPTNILWTVRAQDPTSTSAHPSATISQLLEDVNDIVQLESDDWGLEDYVVEVGGYECLHFQPIDSVLKEDDEVNIRALQTSDLRIRKIGGRHQISSDGRHLFDGVAFGRPYLRKTARPAFRIPPRKRRKLEIEYGRHIENDSVVQSLLPASIDTTDTASECARDEPNLSQSSENPLQIVARQQFEDADQDSADEEDDSDFDSDFESFDGEEGNEEGPELSEELRALLEEDPYEPDGEDDLDHESSDGDPEENSFETIKEHKKRKRDSERELEDDSDSVSESNSQPTLINTAQPDRVSSSSTSTSGRSSEVGDSGDPKEIQQQCFDELYRVEENPYLSDTSSSGSRSSESQNEIGSSDVASSTSGSISSSTDSALSSKSLSESESEMDLESEVDSESKSESESPDTKVVMADAPSNTLMEPNPATKAGFMFKARSVSIHSASGEGSKRTHKKNQRVKRRKKLNLLKAQRLLAPEAGFQELSIFEQTEYEAPGINTPIQQNGLNDVFETRTQELHEQQKAESRPVSAYSARSPDLALPTLEPQKSEISLNPIAARCEPTQEIAKKKSKLDVESSRRMVFGSLGLRTPKTPVAEQELREKLAKQGRRSVNGQIKSKVFEEAGASHTDANGTSQSTETEAWKDKIVLSAVECEVDGQILSTPPFPFVQRWQRAEQNTKQQDHFENSHYPDSSDFRATSNVAGELGSSSLSIEGDSILDGVRLKGVIQNQVIQEAQELSKRRDASGPTAADLPPVSDFDGLGALKIEDAVAGAIVAFKHFEMSKETNWQPEISVYRTAKIEEVLEDGTLKLLLAERDRFPMPSSFDSQTGERVFEKFEMPIDGEDDDPDIGFRELSYGDLIEPKLVEGRPADTSISRSPQARPAFSVESKADEQTSQVRDSAKSTDYSVEQPSAQVEVSTPRQKEISKLIKDAGFHSSLDSELLEPTAEATRTAITDKEDCKSSPQAAEEHSSILPMNSDGASSEVDGASLDSPRHTRSNPNSEDADFHDSSNDFAQMQCPSSSIEESQKENSPEIKKDVAYPRLSPLVIHDSVTPNVSGNSQPEVQHTSPVNKVKVDHESDGVDDEFESTSKPEDSRFDSLRSTIPPSDDAAPKSGPPSPAGSLLTNPVYSSSEDELPSITKLTSTARSGKVSPPPLRKLTNSNRQKKSAKPDLPLGPGETSSTENDTQTQSSGRFQPSQIPPSTQIVDLTMSSSPITADHSDDDYGLTQRGSVRIKQSSSQVEERKTLSSGWKTGNRRLVRGSQGTLK